MTARFHNRAGMRLERLSRLPSPPRIHRAGGPPPSARIGAAWRALPVEGSKAWRDQRQGFLGRLFQR